MHDLATLKRLLSRIDQSIIVSSCALVVTVVGCILCLSLMGTFLTGGRSTEPPSDPISTDLTPNQIDGLQERRSACAGVTSLANKIFLFAVEIAGVGTRIWAILLIRSMHQQQRDERRRVLSWYNEARK